MLRIYSLRVLVILITGHSVRREFGSCRGSSTDCVLMSRFSTSAYACDLAPFLPTATLTRRGEAH